MEMFSFGPWLQRCRCAWLDRLANCRRALVLGDGDGRFTARLLDKNPAVTLDAIDASPAMLRALIRRAGAHGGRVRAHRADVRELQPGKSVYDLVVTHFFLDCLTAAEVTALAKMVRSAITDGARWVVSDFAVPPNRFGRWIARPLVAALYFAFGWLTGLRIRTLPDYAAALGEAGFELERKRTWLGGLLRSEVWLAKSLCLPVTSADNEI